MFGSLIRSDSYSIVKYLYDRILSMPTNDPEVVTSICRYVSLCSFVSCNKIDVNELYSEVVESLISIYEDEDGFRSRLYSMIGVTSDQFEDKVT
jgi:hypothetical protein